jgi:hypothetical protein
MRKLISMFAIACLSGCVAVPRHYSYYDESCGAYVDHMDLEFQELPLWVECHDEDCAAALFITGMVGIVSTIASGAIVAAGNSYYKSEEAINCIGKSQSSESSAQEDNMDEADTHKSAPSMDPS